MKPISRILSALGACAPRRATYAKKRGSLESLWKKASSDEKDWVAVRLFPEAPHSKFCRLCGGRRKSWSQIRARLIERGLLGKKRSAT